MKDLRKNIKVLNPHIFPSVMDRGFFLGFIVGALVLLLIFLIFSPRRTRFVPSYTIQNIQIFFCSLSRKSYITETRFFVPPNELPTNGSPDYLLSSSSISSENLFTRLRKIEDALIESELESHRKTKKHKKRQQKPFNDSKNFTSQPQNIIGKTDLVQSDSYLTQNMTSDPSQTPLSSKLFPESSPYPSRMLSDNVPTAAGISFISSTPGAGKVRTDSRIIIRSESRSFEGASPFYESEIRSKADSEDGEYQEPTFDPSLSLTDHGDEQISSQQSYRPELSSPPRSFSRRSTRSEISQSSYTHESQFSSTQHSSRVSSASVGSSAGPYSARQSPQRRYTTHTPNTSHTHHTPHTSHTTHSSHSNHSHHSIHSSHSTHSPHAHTHHHHHSHGHTHTNSHNSTYSNTYVHTRNNTHKSTRREKTHAQMSVSESDTAHETESQASSLASSNISTHTPAVSATPSPQRGTGLNAQMLRKMNKNSGLTAYNSTHMQFKQKIGS